MKKCCKFLFISFVMSLFLVTSTMNASAFSLSYSGGSVGGSTGATGSSSGYTVHNSNAADNVVGYRFSIMLSNGSKKSGTYTSNCFWNGYENYQKFVLDVGGIAGKRDISDGWTISTTSGRQGHDYTIGEAGFSSVPPAPSGMSGWIQDGTGDYNNLRKVYNWCGGALSSATNDDYLLIEPIINMKLAGVETVATPTELAMYGANVSGGTQYNGSNGNLYNAGSSSLWNLQHYVNREFANLLYVPNDTPFYLSVPNLIGIYNSPSRYTYKQIIDNGLGCSVLKVSNVVPINYTMTYVPQGGIVNGSTANYAYTLSANSNVWYPTPTRDGYSFDGWYDSASGGTNMGGGGTWYVITHNTTLYAHWANISSYTVAYNANGGNGYMASSIVKNGDAIVLADNAFVNPGYTFTGWKLYRNVDATFWGWDWAGNGGWHSAANTRTYYIYANRETAPIGQGYLCSINGETATFIAQWLLNDKGNLYIDTAGGTYNENLFGALTVQSGIDSRARYNVENNAVVVTAVADDGYVNTHLTANLTAGVEYSFSCETDGAWGGNGADTVQAFIFNYSGDYHLISTNNGGTFTADQSGTFYLRLDVNMAGKTHKFWNIKLVESNNLVTGLFDNATTYGNDGRAYYSTGDVNRCENSGVVSVTALMDDGYVDFTSGRVFLTAGTTYRFSCNTNGVWGDNAPNTVEAFLMKGGAYNCWYRMTGTTCEFTASQTGIYYLRLDVNSAWQTYKFWNIKVVPTTNYAYISKGEQNQTYAVKTPTRNGYTFSGWNCTTGSFNNATNTYMFGTSDSYLTAQWTIDPDRDLTVNFVEPNSNYRAGTTVISTFMVQCIGDKSVYPKDNLNLKLSGYYINLDNQTISLTPTEKKYIVIPGNGNNIVYFNWKVPDNCKNVFLTATVNPGNTVVETNYSNNNCTVEKVVSQKPNSVTPDTKFEKQKPSDWYYINPGTAYIDVSSITNIATPTASWSEWIYDEIGKTFIKKTYSATLQSNQSIKPDINTEKFATKLSDTKWQMQSGYGFEYNGSSSLNTNAPSDSVIFPQNGNMYLPDYKYSNALGKYSTLDCLGSGLFQLQKSNYSLVGDAVKDYRRIQFTELWFPDKDYSVDTYLYDSWTPAGMISLRTTINPIAIKGSMYDNWYISHAK